MISALTVYGGLFEDFSCSKIKSGTRINLFNRPDDSVSYQDFFCVANSESCLAAAFKYVEIRPDEDGNGPLITHPKGKRIAKGVDFESVSKY